MRDRYPIALTIDVEDWFCVRNFRHTIPFETWDACELRVGEGMDFLLAELSSRKIKATFFVLGWIAERAPEMVQRIAEAGHEIASHGYSHRGLDQLDPESFEQEIGRTNLLLEGISGQPVRGFRAPSFSLTKQTWWALEVLKRHGIYYDSSIFSIRHPNYGIPSFPEVAQNLGGIVEAPLSAAKIGGVKVPFTGGGYFRLLPYAVTRTLLRQVAAHRPSILYFHPWEFDPGQPRVPGLARGQRFRHYVGLGKNRAKFRRLLDDFEFVTMSRWLAESGFDMARRELGVEGAVFSPT